MNISASAKHLLSLPLGGFKRGEIPVIAAETKPAQSRVKPMDHENGHEIILRTLIRHRTPTRFTLLSGEQVTGTVTQFDKTTITVRPTGSSGKPMTIFKHAIEAFTGLETLQ